MPDTVTQIVGYIRTAIDQDYFKVMIKAGYTLTVNMSGSDKDYDLHLYNGSGRLLKSSSCRSSLESISFQNTGNSAAYYYLRVKGYHSDYSTESPYSLELVDSLGSLSVLVSPAMVTMAMKGTQPFIANVRGTTKTTVNWTCTGGMINANGLYTAPSTPGVYTVKATCVAESKIKAMATVSVTEGMKSQGALYQAEDFTRAEGCSKMTNLAGHTGAGFADMGGYGAWFELSSVTVSEAGNHTLSFRYANGSPVLHPCAVIVNGEAKGTVEFAQTGNWSTWGTAAITVPLNAGNNTIRVQATTSAGGPNVDCLNIQ